MVTSGGAAPGRPIVPGRAIPSALIIPCSSVRYSVAGFLTTDHWLQTTGYRYLVVFSAHRYRKLIVAVVSIALTLEFVDEFTFSHRFLRRQYLAFRRCYQHVDSAIGQ